MSLEAKAHAATDVGRKRRRNEDSHLVDAELGLHAVADGMGGHAAGEVASRRAIEVVRCFVAERADVLRRLAEDPSVDNSAAAQRLLEQAIQTACGEIYGAAEGDPKLRGMGTTFVCLAVAGDRGVVGHVGDSRLYLARRGAAYCLTEDHTLVAAQLKAGEITPEGALRSPFRGVLTRTLGQHESVQVDTLVVELLPGDRFLLCSDGLYGYLTDDDVSTRLATHALEALPADLCTFANERGGSDNITAVVIAIDESGEEQPASIARIDVLQRIPLFAHMTYREQSDVLARATTRTYPAGAVIVSEGEPGGDLFVILDGSVSVERGGLPLATLLAGGHFGEIGLVEAGPRSASVRAIDPIRAMVIRKDDMMALMQREPTLAVKLLWVFVQSLSQRLRATNSDLEEAILSAVPETVQLSKR